MQQEDKKRQSSVSPLAWIAAALVIVALATFALLQKKEPTDNKPEPGQTKSAPAPQPEPTQQEPAPPEPEPAAQASSSQDFRMPPFHQAAEIPALEPTKDPMTVSPAAQAAYQVAQQKPKLLAQLPCFCYCDRFGHGSLHDCFVSEHAETCDVCLKEALQADQLDKQGTPVNEIRDIIVAQFHPRDHDHSH